LRESEDTVLRRTLGALRNEVTKDEKITRGRNII
jgi:hypothetical protein